MGKNTLRINEDMTEFSIFSSKLYTYDTILIKIGTTMIHHSYDVGILGVKPNRHMTLEIQISNVCICSYKLRLFAWSSGESGGLGTEGSRVQGLLEPIPNPEDK